MPIVATITLRRRKTTLYASSYKKFLSDPNEQTSITPKISG